MKTASYGRQPATQWVTYTESDIMVWYKVVYLRNQLLDSTQILNLSLYTKPYLQILNIKTTSNDRLPQHFKSGIS